MELKVRKRITQGVLIDPRVEWRLLNKPTRGASSEGVSLLLGLLAVGDERPSAVVRRTANMALQLRNSGTQSDGRWTPGPPKFPEAYCSLSKMLPSLGGLLPQAS